MSTIGAYDAKTRLPELLRQVKRGKRFTITHRGRPIADLVPSAAAAARNAGGDRSHAGLRSCPERRPGRPRQVDRGGSGVNLILDASAALAWILAGDRCARLNRRW